MEIKDNIQIFYRNINIRIFYNDNRQTYYFTFVYDNTTYEVDCGTQTDNYLHIIYDYIDNLLDTIKYFPQHHGILRFNNDTTITLFYNHMPIKTYDYNLSENKIQTIIFKAEADLIQYEKGVINGEN